MCVAWISSTLSIFEYAMVCIIYVYICYAVVKIGTRAETAEEQHKQHKQQHNSSTEQSRAQSRAAAEQSREHRQQRAAEEICSALLCTETQRGGGSTYI